MRWFRFQLSTLIFASLVTAAAMYFFFKEYSTLSHFPGPWTTQHIVERGYPLPWANGHIQNSFFDGGQIILFRRTIKFGLIEIQLKYDSATRRSTTALILDIAFWLVLVAVSSIIFEWLMRRLQRPRVQRETNA